MTSPCTKWTLAGWKKRKFEIFVLSLDIWTFLTFYFLQLQHSTGYHPYIISRPELYDLLWSQVPRECIHLDKKIVSFDQDLKDIYVRCSDGTIYQGDILIGADGAHSAVRQHLYRSLKAEGKLPKSDDAPLPYSCVCLVGQTEALDPEEFPDLKEEYCKDYSVVGTEKKFSVSFSAAIVFFSTSICLPIGHVLTRALGCQTVVYLHNQAKHLVLDGHRVP